MKKQLLIKSGIGIVAGIVMILISFIGIQTVLPVGAAFMPLAGIIAVGLMMAVGIRESIIITVISTLVCLLLGTADWFVLANYVILLLVINLVTKGRVSLTANVTHQQLLWLAILTGFVELLYIWIIYGLVGLVIGGTTSAGLTFIQQVAPNSLLTGLLYAFFVAPASLLFRWIGKQLFHINNGNHHDDNRSVIVDLSDHQKDDKKN